MKEANSDLTLSQTVGVSGHFTLIVRKADALGEPIPGTERVVAEFQNLITNTGLDYLCSGDMSAQNCQVGSGTNAPANTDSTLQTYIARTASIFSALAITANSSPPYYTSLVHSFRFSVGVATGTLTEIGMGTSSGSAGGLLSRALILDVLGDPTAITVLSTEILDIIYTLRIYPPTTDVVTSVGLFTVTSRAYRVTTSSRWGTTFILSRALVLAFPGGSHLVGITADLQATYTAFSGNASSVSVATYVLGSYQEIGTIIFEPELANSVLGVSVVAYSTRRGSWQIEFSPAIFKTAVQRLTLTVLTTIARA